MCAAHRLTLGQAVGCQAREGLCGGCAVGWDLEECSLISNLCVMELMNDILSNLITELILFCGGALLTVLYKKAQLVALTRQLLLKKILFVPLKGT